METRTKRQWETPSMYYLNSQDVNIATKRREGAGVDEAERLQAVRTKQWASAR